MSKVNVPLLLLSIGVLISCGYVSAFPAVHNGHVHKRQSYGRSNQLAPTQDQYYGQPSYNSYNYNSNNNNGYDQEAAGARRNYYNNNNGYNNGYYQSNYYDYPPSHQHYRDPNYAASSPIQREMNVRNGQLRQKEYQQRTGQDTRDTYDPFYFYPVSGGNNNNNNNGPPQPPRQTPPLLQHEQQPSSLAPASPDVPAPTTVTAQLNAAATSAVVTREHVGGPPRNRRNSLNAPPSRDPYFDNEISGDKYEILTSKPSYPRLQNTYSSPPRYSSSNNGRYTSGTTIGYNHPPPGNPNQFLNYEQIVGAQPPRYANGSPPRGQNQPWSIQIGTQLKVNDDGKGSNSGSRYYVRDERNTRSRLPPFRP